MLAHRPLGRYRVTAMLTTLPYNSFKSYCANTNIYLNLDTCEKNTVCKIKLLEAHIAFSFVDLLCFFCFVFAMTLYASVYFCLVVTCWERAELLAFVCGVLL